MSYDPTLPTPRDRVRFTVGDIYSPELRSDAQYDALITQYGETEAVVRMAESLASEYAQNPSSVNVGGVSVSYSALVSNWQAIAKKYAEGIPSGGGNGLFTSGQVERVGMSPTYRGQYRRPLDWLPNEDLHGDGW